MTAGYRALRETTAQIDLSARGRIRLTGEDRVRLMHAMTTNNIKELSPGQGCYAFFLNAQGRIQADANILCFEDYLLLDTEPETRQFLLEHLDKYIISDRRLSSASGHGVTSTACSSVCASRVPNPLRRAPRYYSGTRKVEKWSAPHFRQLNS